MFYMDTFFSKVKSKRGVTMMQFFVGDKGFVRVYGMKSETEIINEVKLLFKELLGVDPNPNQTSEKVHNFCHNVGTTLCVLEEPAQHYDSSELYIGLMKKSVGGDVRVLNPPITL
jgi:hypothetical protein